MKKQFGEYQRLARGLFSCSSLWQGEDHLLYVRGNGFLIPFSEEYLRFRYKDIQALVIVGTSGRLFSAILFGIGALLFGSLSGLFLSMRDPGELTPLIMTLLLPFPLAMLFLLLFVRTLLLGQRCVVEVQTSLKKERFRMLTRLPLARRIVASVDVVIRQAQDELGVSGVDAVELRSSEALNQAKGLSLPIFALPTFVASVILGGLMLVQLHIENVLIVWTTQVLGLCLVPLVLFVITASVRNLTAEGIRFALWGLLVGLIAVGGGGFIFLANTAVDNIKVTISIFSYIEEFSRITSGAHLGFYLYFLVSSVLILAMGVYGWAQVQIWKGISKK